ncbi:MAG: gamma-glutamyltransferase family protein [Candidatus Accumulibacter sp.]|uniref:gamma-glutamyltransferase family protein n=1 Tax=Accumulibacter sp. TaxID=2053492 RepID=UPI001A485736|nr:gamma-glutamyltransferase family protein [Accumulibacter sp.]MBL8393875.1 gamma-glutamyltransferase family protein [Accumulibacter sp.]
MIHTSYATRGMVVAPHALASQSAIAVLREGGNAIEAMIVAAATIAVAYPHMNSIGGDAFWLIQVPGQPVRALDACGAAAGAANVDWFAARGMREVIPFRGGAAANTVAGTISGWDAAYTLSSQLGGRLPLARLLSDAVGYARDGVPVTRSQYAATVGKCTELEAQPGFARSFLPDGAPPLAGSRFRQPRLAATLEHLARVGLDDFYRGELARSLAADLEAVGSPLRLADLQAQRALWRAPLTLEHSRGTLYNMPPPTQGLVSLLILGLLDRLDHGAVEPEGADYVHLAVEATKQAFAIRDRYLTDPHYMPVDAQSLLADAALQTLAEGVQSHRAAPWPPGRGPADTVWMGAIDEAGCAVSFIQSIYHEFGSGIVLGGSGVNWQNRGCSFSLDARALNVIRPGRKPFHTLNPAIARLRDGRLMVYGSMGGDGQPQSQCAVFTRCAVFGMEPQAAISAPRWLLGRTWGRSSDTLKLESRFAPEVVARLRALGHAVEVLQPFDEAMGHAGCIIRRPDGLLAGGADPRSDGSAAGF